MLIELKKTACCVVPPWLPPSPDQTEQFPDIVFVRAPLPSRVSRANPFSGELVVLEPRTTHDTR